MHPIGWPTSARFQNRAGEYRAWLGALPPPQNLSLPITSFRMEDVEACGQAGAIAFVKQIRAMLAQAAEVMQTTHMLASSSLYMHTNCTGAAYFAALLVPECTGGK